MTGEPEQQPLRFNVLLFPGFETLDVFGPVEVIGKLDRFYQIEFYSESGGTVPSSQNVRVETLPVSKMAKTGVLLIPGGFGTRREVDNPGLIHRLKGAADQAPFVLTVCTGAALLAKTGLLSQVRATTNKRAFDWVAEQDGTVDWVRKARWVHDGKFYSSSGVSAGIDMTLGFVADQYGMEVAEKIAAGIEYIWNKDRENDPFAI